MAFILFMIPLTKKADEIADVTNRDGLITVKMLPE
jgi:hypothetical protein